MLPNNQLKNISVQYFKLQTPHKENHFSWVLWDLENSPTNLWSIQHLSILIVTDQWTNLNVAVLTSEPTWIQSSYDILLDIIKDIPISTTNRNEITLLWITIDNKPYDVQVTTQVTICRSIMNGAFTILKSSNKHQVNNTIQRVIEKWQHTLFSTFNWFGSRSTINRTMSKWPLSEAKWMGRLPSWSRPKIIKSRKIKNLI